MNYLYLAHTELCKVKKFQKCELLWKWVDGGPGLARFFFLLKIVSNSPKPVLIFWSSIPCVFCLYIHCTLLKIISYYHLSVLSMSVMGFQKKVWMVGGWGELYPVLFWIF